MNSETHTDANATKIFCAIDTDDLEHAKALIAQLAPTGIGIKLGLEFFNHFGADGVEKAMAVAPNNSLFLDLKFHDIPNTVAGAVRAVSHRLKPAYLNVHAAGGLEMMQQAKAACYEGSKLLAVTVLTSLDDTALQQVGQKTPAHAQVETLGKLTQQAGLDGVVCSSKEIEILRRTCGDEFALITPGIRPAGASLDDQKRVMTPKQALDLGATHLVIGRPITQADDPSHATRKILESL